MKSFVVVSSAVILLGATTGAKANPVDMAKALSLVPESEATSFAVRSGRWSDPATWNSPPADDGFLVIPEGVDVEQDIDSPRLRKLFVRGALHPAPGAVVTLTVDTLVSDMMSKFYAGSIYSPFTGRWSIVFADYGPIDTDADPWKFGRGAQLMGEIGLFGAPVKGFAMTTGNAAGDTQVRLKEPCEGWNVGDQIVLPGVGIRKKGQPQLIDDDEAFIQSISSDRLTITLTAPLKFAHGVTDRYGGVRPMFAANIARRSIEFRSENIADPTRQGHVMVMRDGKHMRQEFRNVSFRRLGRTDKSKPLTDPDGQGGGTANERGRYALHFHKCNPDRSGMEAIVNACLFRDSIGWGCVNHSSFVCMTDCVSYRAFGAHFAGENGDETGCMGRNVAVRATSTITGGLFGALADNNDWFKNGHGFATMCGGIRIWDCIATGCPSEAFVVMGPPFGSKPKITPPIMFESKNLTGGDTYSEETLEPHFVPQRHSGLRWFGCRGGILAWAINGQSVLIPKVGRSSFTDCAGESTTGLFAGYLSNLDVTRFRCVRIPDDWTVDSEAFGHTGSNTSVNYDGVELYDFPFGIRCPVTGTNVIKNCRMKCLIGFWCGGAASATASLGPREIEFINNAAIPFSASEWSRVRNAIKSGPGARSKFALYTDRSGPVLYWMGLQDQPSRFLRNVNGASDLTAYFCATLPHFYGTVTIDGKYAHYYEQGPSFRLDLIPTLPPVLKGLTTREMWDQFGLAFGGNRCPPDAVVLPGSQALVSNSPPIAVPIIKLTKTWPKKAHFQQTNVTSGYVAKVKDAAGKAFLSAPTNLTPGWNIVTLQVNGQKRGVWVLCDPDAEAVASW